MAFSREELQDWLVTQVAQLLDAEASQVNVNNCFRDYGMDSVMALRLVNLLRTHLGYDIPATLPWKYPSIISLAQKIIEGDSTESNFSLEDHEVLEPIAIIGMACRLPGGVETPADFLELLINGVDTTREVPANRWNVDHWYNEDRSQPGKMNTRRGAFLESVDQFDAAFWGISPREAVSMDPQQRLFMEMCWEALEDAGIVPATLKKSTTGVFAGAMWQDYSILRGGDSGAITQHTLAGQDISIIPSRVSYALGLRGPCLTVNTACSSSLVAVHLACSCLQRGDAVQALVGGINLMLAPHSAVAISKFGGLAPDGRSKTFDASADGYGRGEGGAVVVLKPLSRALRDGDHIYCLIRGSAMNSDGASNGLTAPCPDAQHDVLKTAWSFAGAEPHKAVYVETHGTGTKLGDPIEAEALGSVFGHGREADQPLRIGSVKTNIGHLEAASGMAGLIKMILSISEKALFASLHFNTPNPHINFEELKLKVQTTHEPWPDKSRLAGISSFGFGGTNSHLVLDGAPGDDISPTPKQVQAPGEKKKNLVFLYSGYGSQWPGMGQQLLYREPVFREAVKACDEAFAPLVDFSVYKEFCETPHRSRIDRTDIGQALCFTFQYALTELLNSWNVVPNMIIGQSLGEIMGTLAAGILDLKDAAKVLAAFAKLGMLAEGRGGMAVIALSAEEAQSRIDASGGGLTVAGYLSRFSTVIAGDIIPLEDLMAQLRGEGIDTFRIKNSYACHCLHMEPHLQVLEERLADIRPRKALIPTISTVHGNWLEGPECDAAHWAENNKSPVVLMQSVQKLLAFGDTIFVEISPHQILRQPLQQIIAEFGDQPGRDSEVWGSCWNGENERESLMDLIHKLRSQGIQVGASTLNKRWPMGVSSLNYHRPYLFPLSARTPEALQHTGQRLKHYLERHPQLNLPDVAYSLATSRTLFNVRKVLVAESREELLSQLADPSAGFHSRDTSEHRGKIAFLFTGQGSQYPHMGLGLYYCQWSFRQALDDCVRHLDTYLDQPLLPIMFAYDDVDEQLIHQTAYAQPALFALEYATFQLWRSWGIKPGAVLGHSVGEIAAACAIGVLSLEEGCRLIALRGKLMNALPQGGGMLAVSANESTVAEYLQDTSLCLAAVNGRNATVVSGSLDELNALAEQLGQAGINSKQLQVSHAFHSALMDPILDEFREVVSSFTFGQSSIPLVSNLSGDWADEQLKTPEYWAQHLRNPVQFKKGIQTLYEAGYTAFIEVGPRPVLLGMAADLLGEHAALLTLPSMRKTGREVIWESLARLHSWGERVSWQGLYYHLPVNRISLPTYPFQRTRYWMEQTEPKAQPLRIRKNQLHPLLDQRLQLAVQPKQHFYRAQLSEATLPFLQDHRIHGYNLLPVITWVEVMFAAARESRLAQPILLEQVAFKEQLVLTEVNVSIQVVLSPQESDRWHISIHCQKDGDEDKEYRCYASATLAVLKGKPVGASLASLQDLFTQEKSVERFYKAFHERGIEYGPGFQRLAQMWQMEDEALALIQLDASFDQTAFFCHPALIEGCIQAALGCLPHPESLGHYMPVTIDRLAVFQPLPAKIWCHARLNREEERSHFDIEIFHENGERIASIMGLTLALKAVKRQSIDKFLYDSHWIPMERRPKTTSPLKGSWLIIADTHQEGHKLAAELTALGEHCVLAVNAESFAQETPDLLRFNHNQADQYTQVLRAMASAGTAPSAVVYMAGLDTQVDQLNQLDFDAIYARGCRGMHSLFKAVLHHAPVNPALFVLTRGCQPVGENPSMPGLGQAPLWHMARVITAEHPELHCRCIDLDPQRPDREPETLAHKLRDLASGESPENMIALRDGLPFVPRLRRYHLNPATSMEISPNACYLITGGLGGLGISLASYLVEQGARHLILTSRRGATPDHLPFMDALRAQGASLTPLAIDVTDHDQLENLLAKWGGPPLKGIVHAAGVIEDGVLASMDEACFKRVLWPKMVGAWNLHRVSLHLPLDFFVLFSSVASLFSPPGQGNYSAANGFMDALAHYRGSQGLPALSMNWGAFYNLGMTAKGVSKTWEDRGMLALHPDQGWQGLMSLPQSGLHQVAMMSLGETVFSLPWTASPFFQDMRSEETPAQTSLPIDALRGLSSSEERKHYLAAFLRKEVGAVLGFSPENQLSRKEAFIDLGMDSLLGTELRNRLQTSLNCRLPPALIFECPTLETMEAFLIEHLFEEDPPEPLAIPSAPAQLDPLGEVLHVVLEGLGAVEDTEERFDSLIDAELAALEELGIEI